MKWIFVIIAFVGTLPALAADLPSRKPGLWEITTTVEGGNPQTKNSPAQVLKQCIDKATDPMTLSIAGPFSPAVCPKREVKSSGDTITVDFDLHDRQIDRDRACRDHRQLRQRLYDDSEVR